MLLLLSVILSRLDLLKILCCVALKINKAKVKLLNGIYLDKHKIQ